MRLASGSIVINASVFLFLRYVYRFCAECCCTKMLWVTFCIINSSVRGFYAAGSTRGGKYANLKGCYLLYIIGCQFIVWCF